MRHIWPFVKGFHRWPVDSPHNGSVMRFVPLQWCHNERDGVSNHRRLDCLLNRLFRRRSKKISNTAPLTPSQRASNAENVSIWWRHHAFVWCLCSCWLGAPMKVSEHTVAFRETASSWKMRSVLCLIIVTSRLRHDDSNLSQLEIFLRTYLG